MKLQIELSKDNSVKINDYKKLVKLTNADQDANLNFISADFVSVNIKGFNTKGKLLEVSKHTQRNLTGLITIIKRSADYMISENKKVKSLQVTVEY